MWPHLRERRWFVLKRPRSDINGESESEVTVTSKLHAQRGIQNKEEDQGRKPLIVGPVAAEVSVLEAHVGHGSIGPQRLPVTESALAQVPAESPAHALNGSIVPPVAKMAAEDYNREGVVRAPPSDRSDPSRAMGPMEPIRAPVLRVPRLAPPRAVHTGVTTQNGHFPRNHPPVVVERPRRDTNGGSETEVTVTRE